MPRYSVEYSGKWACFSSITDSFITQFADKSEYEKWRIEEYRNNFKPVEESNLMDMKDAASRISLNRSSEEALECLLVSGLPEADSKQILYDMETENYVPIPKSDGRYECPNCRRGVEKRQKQCESEDCCLNFIWRG